MELNGSLLPSQAFLFHSLSFQVIKNLGANPLVIQLPIGQEDSFRGLIDLVKMKALVWDGEVRRWLVAGGWWWW